MDVTLIRRASQYLRDKIYIDGTYLQKLVVRRQRNGAFRIFWIGLVTVQVPFEDVQTQDIVDDSSQIFHRHGTVEPRIASYGFS